MKLLIAAFWLIGASSASLRGAFNEHDDASPLRDPRQLQTTLVSIPQLRLINADTDKVIAGFDNLLATTTSTSIVIDLTTVKATNLSLQAVTKGLVQSVRWLANGKVRTESAPAAVWSLCGVQGSVSSSSDFASCSYLKEGYSATISVTPYTLRDGKGLAGKTISKSIVIVRSVKPTPMPVAPPPRRPPTVAPMALVPVPVPVPAPVPVPLPVPVPVPVPLPVPVSVPVPVSPPVKLFTHYIHDIQGNGASVKNPGLSVTIVGIATSILQSNDVLDGFFVQEEDLDADQDSMTSQGIFVSCRGKCTTNVNSGDVVQVVGIVAEVAGSSQIDVTGGYKVLSTGNALPTPTAIRLPAMGSTKDKATFEHVEGMLVTFPGTLVVSEYYGLARFGQLVLTDSTRPFQFTNNNVPSVAGYAMHRDDLAKRVIILDDNTNDQNDSISSGTGSAGIPSDEPYAFPKGGLSVSNKFRGGDTIVGLTGVLQYYYGAWRIRPVSPQYFDYSFAKVNPAPAIPPTVGGGRLRVASFNVLNYFTTLNNGAAASCGPTGGQECRGANSAAELARQRAKIVAALDKLDADIVGLVELQNAADDAPIADLVSALNVARSGSGGSAVYSYIATGAIGTDAIRCGILYKTSTVAPYKSFKVLTRAIDANYIDDKNRPSLIQTFQETASGGGRLTVSVNHFKSKGSACSDLGDPDLNDGQANCSQTRKKAALALANYLKTDPTGSGGDPDYLILGDLNANAKEDAIVALEQAGYVNLATKFASNSGSSAASSAPYSYVFDGQLGSLDYALASPTLVAQVTGAADWHINADEVPLFDYNDDIQDKGENSFERKSSATTMYANDPFRSSDHDPLLVGIALTSSSSLPVATPVAMPVATPVAMPVVAAPVATPVAVAPAPTPTTTTTNTPMIVITEIMKNPNGVADEYGEWFELYNAGPTSVNIMGWTVKDVTGKESFKITSPLVVERGMYVVLGTNGNTATNGGVKVHYVYPSAAFALVNSSDDSIVLVDAAGIERDRVVFTNSAFPNVAGKSMALKSVNIDNNLGSNWCVATTPYSNWDFGTPGKANNCP